MKNTKRLNPKKHRSARRKRSTDKSDVVRIPSIDSRPLCKNCNLRSSEYGSCRCKQCTDEFHASEK